MKRASTKVSMPKFEDGTQKKISSFFQKGSAPAQSKLFTSVRKARPSPLLQQQLKASSNSCPETVSACSNDISSHDIVPKAAWIDNYNVQSQDETSVCKTPEKPESRLEVVVGESPDVVVIPDTPEEKLEKPRLKKISRSFLCPVDLLTTRPCRKPSLSKVKVKHKTKSSLGPVTIEFGQKRQGDDQGNDFSKKTGTQFANNVNSTDMWLGSELLDLDDDAGPASFACKPMSSLPEQTQPYFRQAELNSAAEDSRLSVMHAKLSTNGRSVKRMSQPGLSPAAKKTLFTEVMLKDNIDKCFNTNHKVKAKRQLAVMNGFKDVKEMNQSVNGYQMGIDASVRQNSVSCAEDDVLADILGQMISIPTEQQGQPEKVPNSITFISVSQPERKFLKESLDCHAADDEVLTDILGELKDFVNQGHSLGSEISTASKTSDLPVKKLIPVSYNDNLVRKPTLSHTRLLVDKGIKISEIVKPNSQKRNLSDKSLAEHLVYTHTVDEKDHLSSAHLCHGEETSRAGKMPATKMQLDLTADMEETLSESFEHMSPFKTSTLRESVQSPAESQTTSQLTFVNRWNRFVVQGVNHDRQSHTIALELSEEGGTRVNRYAVLQGSWSDILVETGDIVHLVFDGKQASDDIKLENSNNCPVVIDDEQGLIAVNPDILLSGTSIVSGIHCLRRSVLNEKFKGVDSKNVHMLYGSVIHSLFQEVLKNRLTKTEEILTTAMSVIQSNKFLHDMYGQSVTETQVTDEIQAYIEPLQAWLKKYVPSTTETRNSRCSDLSIVQIHDIEETIWSPRLGVKGKIDMTVEVEIQENGKLRKKILPLELKTGKASYSAEHKGQVTLYSMMMADRHENVDEGLLLYLKHNDMNSVPVKPENKRGLVQLRNEMAYYLRRHAEKTRDDKNDVIYKLGQLPHPINSFQSCSKCPQLINCAIYQRSVEDMKHISGHAMNDLVPDSLSHLSESHLKYFTHWILCMDLEMAHQHTEGLSNIWRKSSSEREQCGDCLQQLMIVDSVLGVPETQAFTEGKGCCVQFQRKPGFEGGLLNGVGLTKNDSVVISSEDGKYIALSTGFIKHMTESVVDVVVDRDSFHENIAFQSLVFRIDRCDVFNTSGYLLTNLYRLMEPSQHRQKLRSLIIDHKKPEFQLKMAKSAVEKVKQIFKPLNKPQKTAILKVLMAKDFVLIKGYPGTGKTSTIVALVKILKELGQSVLLTSYTHSAVDNILLKLKKDGVPFLRLGRSSRIHPLIQDHASETLTLDCRSVDELRDLYNSYNIIATSCLGSNHPVFTQRRFDVCIVDEASQVLQPACLGPLFSSSRFVLVGDPQQLPPIVQSREASLLGMEESLFVRLDGAGATYDLTLQYRMNSTIMQLSNELVYQGALQCGDDKVSQACIQHSQSFPSGQPEWLMRALDTSLTNAVVFLDTCQMVAPESCEGRGLTNDVEADLIWRLAVAFRQAGISATEIGVITPYRAQVKALQRRLSECLSVKDIEVNTVDQYQGRDKSVVLISFVRSAAAIDPIMKGNLLQDIRRLNVALTRAKNKLVLVGNSSTLSNYCPIGNLLKILQSKQHIFVLPAELSI